MPVLVQHHLDELEVDRLDVQPLLPGVHGLHGLLVPMEDACVILELVQLEHILGLRGVAEPIEDLEGVEPQVVGHLVEVCKLQLVILSKL